MNNKVLIILSLVVMTCLNLFLFITKSKSSYSPLKNGWSWKDDWGKEKMPVSPPGPTPRSQVVATDYNDAIAKSKTHNLPVLIFFTSPTCTWCTKMKNDVLPIESVKTSLKQYVFVELDATLNQTLSLKHNVKGVPHFVVLNSNENALSTAKGYMDVNKFVSFLNNDIEVVNLYTGDPPPVDMPILRHPVYDEGIH